MGNRRAAGGSIGLVGAALVLAGCYDVFPNLTVVNASGVPVTLVKERRDADPERVRVGPGAESRPVFPYLPDFVIEANGCAYRYLLPEMDVNHPWRTSDDAGRSVPDYGSFYPVRLQLGRDFSLNLLSVEARGIEPEGALKSDQGHGFPVRPASVSCG